MCVWGEGWGAGDQNDTFYVCTQHSSSSSQQVRIKNCCREMPSAHGFTLSCTVCVLSCSCMRPIHFSLLSGVHIQPDRIHKNTAGDDAFVEFQSEADTARAMMMNQVLCVHTVCSPSPRPPAWVHSIFPARQFRRRDHKIPF